MPDLSVLLLFAGAAALLALMPGAGLLYVAGRTLAGGWGHGIASSLGTGLGGMAHVAAGVFGVSALLMASATAFTVLKVVGGLYLIWLGWQTWRHAGGVEKALNSAAPMGAPSRVLRQGFIVEATNPKTAAFFLALIPQFVDPAAGPVGTQFAILGSVAIVLNTGAALGAVALASALRRTLAGRACAIQRVQRGSGALLALLGASLLFARRPVS